ncbi:glycosyl hydrolase [Draconibacterium sediminis]|uniref:glycosyl hydrolase n=1 Tax=Draconibacterium sediminis TaxID=1544798 RepID=UPI0026ECF1D1|nr:glycosyl hydrolase [Draconibacterium sediminis]
MKKNILMAMVLLAGIGLNICVSCKKQSAFSQIESGFKTIPDSIQTSVYWYWLSDNISKEGVIKDLEAMKKVGINRAFIGNIGYYNVPHGDVKFLSDEWYEVTHAALKRATELNIEIGMFNSAGWSQSGGPWVKPEISMRYFTSTKTKVKGPGKISQLLDKPEGDFQDVKVIAYPSPRYDQLILDKQNCTISSLDNISGLSKILDGDEATGFTFPEGEQFTLDFNAKKEFTARSLTIQTTQNIMFALVTIQAKSANGEYTTIREFELNRTNASTQVGFIPYAPVVVSFPATTSSNFRLIFNSTQPSYRKFSGLNEKDGLTEVIFSTAPRVENYAEKTLAKMFSAPLPYWNEYQWEDQAEVDDTETVIDPTKVIDISAFTDSDGMLTWDVPEGDWIILRTGMKPTGVENGPASREGVGLEIDKMSKEHIRFHFDSFLGKILERIPAEDRKTFKVAVQDSWEKGSQNFTDGFLEDFQQTYGYDPLPFLPVYRGMVVESQKASDRFLWDVRRLVADKVAYDYVAGLREVCHENGLTTWLENYGHWGFPGEFLQYGGQSDEIAGEFWSTGSLGDIENRAATSCGHIYGKTKISAESNTSGGPHYARYPGVIKQRGDRFSAEGINNTLLHVYIQQPYEDKNPGMNAWFGNEFHRKNTWFSQIDVYIEYLKRCNFMLQQGLNVADVAYFIGEDAPKMTGITDPALPVGYQFDYMNAEVILNNMTVEDGLITLPHGTQYRILVLPKLETMRPELTAKIKQLVEDGAVVMGPAPTHSPSLQDQPEADKQVLQLASELWGDVDGVNVKHRKFGKGMIMNGMGMAEAFEVINCVPDCKLPEDNTIHYGHRTLEVGDIYFVTNQTDHTKIITPEFRVTGMQPELWEATTGYIRNLPAYKQTGNTTAVPLKLEAYESVFIVFRNKAYKPSASGIEANYPTPTLLANITNPWTVNFDSTMRGPNEPVVFDTLQDWTISNDDRIKYYSGTAFYNNTFNVDILPSDEKVVIDLGSFTAMAKVYVNDQYAGGLWTAPYQLDITDLIKQGENQLKIEIVNTWMNRIIGDLNLPEEERKIWMSYNTLKADNSLQPSGLFGPVKILELSKQN